MSETFRTLVPLTVVLAAVCGIVSCGKKEAAAPAPRGLVSARDVLTPDDLQGYYNLPFKVANESTAGDAPSPGIAHVHTISYVSADDGPDKAIITLLLRQSASLEEALGSADRARHPELVPNLNVEDAPGIGEDAFWLGHQLNFVHGPFWVILTASGLKNHRNADEQRAAATALSQKILEHLK